MHFKSAKKTGENLVNNILLLSLWKAICDKDDNILMHFKSAK